MFFNRTVYIKKIKIVREYNSDGKLIKETTETANSEPDDKAFKEIDDSFTKLDKLFERINEAFNELL
jgi:hypothetical protein